MCGRLIRKATIKGLRWLYRKTRDGIVYIFTHPWCVVGMLAVVIMFQSYLLIKERMRNCADSKQLYELQCQVDSANMTAFKLSK